MTLANHIVEVDIKRNHMDKENKEKNQKLKCKNSKIKEKLRDAEEKNVIFGKNIEKIKDNYEKQLRKFHDLDANLKKEKVRYEKLRECIEFNQVEQHELETALRDTIDDLNGKVKSFEERDK